MRSIVIITCNEKETAASEIAVREAFPTTEVWVSEYSKSIERFDINQNADVVFVDLEAGDDRGLDALRTVRRRRPHVPIIALHEECDAAHGNKAFEAGAAFSFVRNGSLKNVLQVALDRLAAQSEIEKSLRSKSDAMDRSSRLDAAGQLAAGVAHDFNNQLGALRYSIELLKNTAVTEEAKGHIATALSVIENSSSLAKRLLKLSKSGELLAKTVSLSKTLSDLRALATPSVSGQVALEVLEPDADVIVCCDGGQLLNALMNLTLNADDAVRAKGGSGVVRVYARTDVEGCASIVVEDRGIGMTDAVLEKCFDPFFTTKADRNGTGLGLAMVQSFAADNHGQVEVTSGVNKGTTVTLTIPKSSVDLVQSKAPETSIRKVASGSKVLLVEDQLELSFMTKGLLESEGLVVQAVSDATLALEVLAEGAQFDLVITDINMPGKSGFELVQEIQKTNPETRVIYVSGYIENPRFENQVLFGPILQKPVEPADLLSTIGRVLAST